MGAVHIFGPVIQIRKDLGHVYFWSQGQSISLTLNYFNIMIWAMLGTPASISISIILFYIFLWQRQRKKVLKSLTPEVDPPIIIIVIESRKVMQWSRMPVSKLTLSQGGATTLSIMTLKKMSCSILSLSIMTLKRKNVKKWETQYYIMLSSIMLSVFMQNVNMLSVVVPIIFFFYKNVTSSTDQLSDLKTSTL